MTLSDTEWEDTTGGDHDGLDDDQAEELEAEAAAAGDALDAAAESEPATYFKTLPEFVDQFLIKAYRRNISAQTPWCREWWKHCEAVCVLSALWRAWEALRLEPGTGMSVWWRDHCYLHMNSLMNPAGTFSKCTVAGHHSGGEGLEPLSWATPPAELYDPLTYGG
ncbi:DUF4913 domain-containing protein [Kribbella soli]|uniref:DUF4913 domain-containing protein n=1 Tax=Kribbella soli TaxID=1124743 RepID=A0A4R0HC11_9ACTN|nr:DUF4913 domain-containing protein [Kribbella soli]TCC06262.1 DUF4913 domain-containing protein [Kribbella soli]